MWKILFAWFLAVLTGAVSGSFVQSWVSTAAIARIHEPVALADRLYVVGHDLVHFAPTWGAIMALGLLVAFSVAAWLGRRWPHARGLLFPLAGMAAVWTALLIMEQLLPVTVVAAARGVGGWLSLGLGGALAGVVFFRVSGYRSGAQSR